jgi:hypothetical protein
MEQLAPPGSIRLTAETLRLSEGLVQVSPLGPVPISVRWRSPASTRNAATRPMPCASSARSPRGASLWRAMKPEIIITGPAPWPRSWGCGVEAHAALSAAVELYRAMEMTLWLHQAEATLAAM